MSNLINVMTWNKDLFGYTFVPHFIILVQSDQYDYMKMFESRDKECFKIVLERLKIITNIYLVRATITSLIRWYRCRNQLKRINLQLNLTNEEDYIIIKKKIKSLINEYTSFVVFVDSLDELKESMAFRYDHDFDQKLERTIFIIQTQYTISTIKAVMSCLRINHYITNIQQIHVSLTNLTMDTLKFKIHSLHKTITQKYTKFASLERKHTQILKLQSSSEECSRLKQLILYDACVQTNCDLNGEYSKMCHNYHGCSLKANIMDMLDTHFTQLKGEYVDLINGMTYGHIRRSMRSHDIHTLSGFLTQQQFTNAFGGVMGFLHERSLVVLPQLHELISQTILKQFKKMLKLFHDKQMIMNELTSYLQGISQVSFKFIQEVTETIIQEIYFNDDIYAINTVITDEIWEVKRIGTLYFRNIILQIQDNVYRLLMSKYVRQVQQTLLKKVMELQMSNQLDEDYTQRITLRFESTKHITSVLRLMNSNEVIQYYLSLKVETTQKQQPDQEQPTTQRIGFRQRIKQFFTRTTKKEKLVNRTVAFTSSPPKKYRQHSPQHDAKLSHNVIEKASLASEFILMSNLDERDVEPLTLGQWLKISNDDNLFKELSRQKLKVSLAKGIPSGMRSSIWSQFTRIELRRHPQLGDLRDSYERLKHIQSDSQDQIALDVKRTVQMFSRQKEEFSEMLKNILTAYSNWDKVLGYTQGMNFITVALLNVYSGLLKNQEFQKYQDIPQFNSREIELNSFLTLVMIMKCRNWDEVLGPKTPKLVQLLIQFELIFKQQFPLLMSQMDQFGFTYVFFKCYLITNSPQIMVTHYIISIMTTECPHLFSVRVLDIFLLEGHTVVMDTLKFLFTVSQKDILKITDQNQYFIFIRNQLCGHVLNKCQNELERVFFMM